MLRATETAVKTAAREKTVVYTKLPTRSGPCKMHARLFLPERTAPPLLIWFHSGGFHRGSIEHPEHEAFAQEFAARGLATAFVEYRLQTPKGSLSTESQNLLPDLVADANAQDFGLKPFLYGSGAIGAVENAIVFLQWLHQIGPQHGLTGPLLIGGSSAGAMTVLNMLSLAPHLGIKLPTIHAAFAMSGAFAYPSFFTPSPTPILAVHRPNDHKVPVESIRAYARQARETCMLIERPRHPHGGLKFYPKEQLTVAVDRMIGFAQGNGVSGFANP